MSLIVSIGFVKNDDSILLIRRDSDTYDNMLALPGGKVEENEHNQVAVEREIKEEAGINCNVTNFHGVVSEFLYENDEQINKFCMSIFELEPQEIELESSNEGDVGWYRINDVRDQIIPSDLKIIESVIDSEQYYFECQMSDDELVYFRSEQDKGDNL